MEALGEYESSEGSESPILNEIVLKNEVNIAPTVPSLSLTSARSVLQTDTTLATNVPVSAFNGVYEGPKNPFATFDTLQAIGSGKRTSTGVVEHAAMENYHFEMEERRIGRTQILRNPKASRRKKKDKLVLGTDDDDIWVPMMEKPIEVSNLVEASQTEEQQQEAAERLAKRAKHSDEAKQDMEFDKLVERKQEHLLPARLQSGQEAAPARSVMHDKGDELDYQGRSWIEAPSSLKVVDIEKVYLPKKCIHQWVGHTKGVQKIEFMPVKGHLLLSGSMDHTVKIWDVYKNRKLKRTYYGHSGAVRDINFSSDGRTFLSCGFDRFVRLWDTETGQCLNTFTNRRVPYCVKFYPEDDNIFVVGDSNNMIVQYDCTTGAIVQEYNHHLQAVNSVTFIDDNRRFVSTSDDKKILVWEWNIPVPIKYISEPSMHSMPAVTIHPSGDYFAGQSLNNQIDVYGARDKYKISRKKVFRGHSTAGYACQIGFSPNGQYIMSGDAGGMLSFWDWKTTKNFKKLKCHTGGPTMGAIWHPLEQSRVATCGWDGLIKYWD